MRVPAGWTLAQHLGAVQDAEFAEALRREAEVTARYKPRRVRRVQPVTQPGWHGDDGEQQPRPQRPRKPKRQSGKGRRERVAKRDGWRCVWCRCPLTREDATLEHLVPKWMGGTDALINLALACERCNRARGGRPCAPPPRGGRPGGCCP